MVRLASRSTAFAVLACAMGYACAMAQPVGVLSPEQIARIDSVVAAVMADNSVVGLQVAVGVGDAVVWTDGYGMADLENEVPVTSRSRFRTASISKWMTATAVMALVEQGLLDLDAPVQAYCPQYPEKRWTVTTRHLLTHRAGVRHYWGANDEPRATPAQREALERSREDERLGFSTRYTDVIGPLDRFKDDALLFEPGTQFRYTSHGYRLVGCIVQGAAGTSYRALMEDRVFEPAGMTLTRDDDAYALIPDRVRGYARNPDGTVRRSAFRDVSENLPAGGHVSTAADLVRFALAFHQDVLVSPESRAQMTARPSGSEDDGSYYGFGVSVTTLPERGGETVWTHSGGQDETRTLLVLVPSVGIAIALMTNDERFSGGPMRTLVGQVIGIVQDS